ncbi:bombyxin C-2-like [Aethina tumida]|uniref:bombyxin C-2-like n=1 Tax=Aethina tumida TaxID=116153 RepID=UPI002148B889|nr:bombyxin C-2-like [Aethina tumida]
MQFSLKMNYQTGLIIFLSICFAFVSCAQFSPPFAETGERHYCGDELALKLHRVCGGRYATYNKKSVGRFWKYRLPEDGDMKQIDYYDDTDDILVGKRGIVHDCCYKPCTEAYMSLYCE